LNKRKRNGIEDLLKKVNVVSQEEAEEVDVVICMPDGGPRYFSDDVSAFCASCGIAIHHRPHVPKKPPKVCIHCGLRMVEADKARDGDQPSDEQRAALRARARRQKLRRLKGD